MTTLRTAIRGLILTGAILLASCGGGGGGSSASGGGGGGGGTTTPPPPPPPPPPLPALLPDNEAARFLTQATFGVTDADLATLKPQGYSIWLTNQMAMPPSASHLTFLDNRLVQIQAQNPTNGLTFNEIYGSFWVQAATGQDQLRQRAKFALSQIFVISLNDGNIDYRGAVSFYDMLGQNAFGNYRQMLEQVALHPQMGIYLSHMANVKENLATGQHPDENFAREIMQLMSIGVHRLNLDGTPQLSGGQPIPTYTGDDISNLAKVFTGFSWYNANPSNATFNSNGRTPESYTRSMIAYNGFHSTSAKTFLGVTIPASSTANAAGDLKIALDTIADHPNVGPFMARRLIQNLVTSNPSPAYVARVATVFNNNGSGVRGDMAAVFRAILTDDEARNLAHMNNAGYGKVREPVVRLGNWMRSFGATSVSGAWDVRSTSANTSLSQSALTAPSVFNFYRPGYVPPNTKLGAQNITAPEFQIVDEITVAGYINTMSGAINNGIGGGGLDVRTSYPTELALGNNNDAILDRVNKLLLYGQMSSTLRSRITDAMNGVPAPSATASQGTIDTTIRNKVKIAILLAMASPEYLVQR